MTPWSMTLRRWRLKRRRDRKLMGRADRDWYKYTRRLLDRHDYWTRPVLFLGKRKSEGRNARLESWRSRQPFVGRIGWLGQIVSVDPEVNMRITLP